MELRTPYHVECLIGSKRGRAHSSVSALEDVFEEQRSSSSSHELAPDTKATFPGAKRKASFRQAIRPGRPHAFPLFLGLHPATRFYTQASAKNGAELDTENESPHATTAVYAGLIGGWGKACYSISATEINVAALTRSSMREEVEIALQDEHHIHVFCIHDQRVDRAEVAQLDQRVLSGGRGRKLVLRHPGLKAIKPQP